MKMLTRRYSLVASTFPLLALVLLACQPREAHPLDSATLKVLQESAAQNNVTPIAAQAILTSLVSCNIDSPCQPPAALAACIFIRTHASYMSLYHCLPLGSQLELRSASFTLGSIPCKHLTTTISTGPFARDIWLIPVQVRIQSRTIPCFLAVSALSKLFWIPISDSSDALQEQAPPAPPPLRFIPHPHRAT